MDYSCVISLARVDPNVTRLIELAKEGRKGPIKNFLDNLPRRFDKEEVIVNSIWLALQTFQGADVAVTLTKCFYFGSSIKVNGHSLLNWAIISDKTKKDIKKLISAGLCDRTISCFGLGMAHQSTLTMTCARMFEKAREENPKTLDSLDLHAFFLRNSTRFIDTDFPCVAYTTIAFESEIKNRFPLASHLAFFEEEHVRYSEIVNELRQIVKDSLPGMNLNLQNFVQSSLRKQAAFLRNDTTVALLRSRNISRCEDIVSIINHQINAALVMRDLLYTLEYKFNKQFELPSCVSTEIFNYLSFSDLHQLRDALCD